MQSDASSLKTVPGPRGLPLVGALPALIRAGGIIPYITQLQRKYGDSFRLCVGPQGYSIFTHPDHIERILKAPRTRLIKGAAFDQLRLLTGNGLLTDDGPDWLRRRRLAAGAFHSSALAKLIDQMAIATDQSLERLRRLHPDGAVVDMQPHMVRLTLEIVGEALFGVGVADGAEASGRAFATALEVISDRGNAPFAFPMAVPTPANQRLKRALTEIRHTVNAVIDEAERKQGVPGTQPTLLGMLMAARGDNGEPGLTRAELYDEVVTMFLAGHETTALTMTWALHLLGTRPAIWERIREEANAKLASPTFESIRSLTYTRQVVDEVLRLRSPVWSTVRTVVEPETIGGCAVPPGAMVMPTFYLTHRHRDFWDDPERFDPERFASERVAQRHAFAYAPFGGGPRVCIGQGFALVESQLILARLAQTLEISSLGTVGIKAGATLRPDGPVFIRLRWR